MILLMTNEPYRSQRAASSEAALLRLWPSSPTESKNTLLRIGLGVTRHPRMGIRSYTFVYDG